MNVTINVIEGSISARVLDIGEVSVFVNGNGRRDFKSKAGITKAIRAELAHYPTETFAAFIGHLNDGTWVGFIREEQ